jgi:AraC-like DNA-binding protein
LQECFPVDQGGFPEIRSRAKLALYDRKPCKKDRAHRQGNDVLMNLLYLLVIGAGWFLAANLFLRGGAANRIYAMLMMIFMFEVFMQFIFREYGDRGYEIPFGIRDGLFFAYGPLTYLYTGLVTGRVERVSPRNLLHFGPTAIVTISSAFLWEETSAFFLRLFPFALALPLRPREIFYLLVFVSAATYLGLSLKDVASHRDAFRSREDEASAVRLRWLLAFILYCYSVLAFFAISTFVYLRFRQQSRLTSHLFCLHLSLPVYASGYMALVKSSTYSLFHARQSEVGAEAKGKYSRSKLPENVAAEYERRIRRLLHEGKAFQDSELTLGQFAGKLGISPSYVSQVLSLRFGTGFNDLVNEARIAYAKALLSDPSSSGSTILDIAYEAGFNSKTTFYALFKKSEGLTPSEFRRQRTGLS